MLRKEVSILPAIYLKPTEVEGKFSSFRPLISTENFVNIKFKTLILLVSIILNKVSLNITMKSMVTLFLLSIV